MIAERHAGKAQGADVDLLVQPAISGGNGGAEPARTSKHLDQPPAFGLYVAALLMEFMRMRFAPERKRIEVAPVAVLEEGPGDEARVRHLNSPRRPASAWRRTRCRRARNPASACRLPAPGLLLRSQSRPASPIPSRADSWSCRARRSDRSPDWRHRPVPRQATSQVGRAHH